MIDFPTCGVQAFAGIRVPLGEIADLRKNAGKHGGRELAPLVRQSDEQTVLALTAVMSAIDNAGWNDRSFANWAVAASGRSLGRIRFDACLERFRRLKTRGVSPLVIPHLSLHSIAGTLSIVLQMHGPHYGVSGRPNHLSEALLAGIGAIQSDDVDGLWIVATELAPEPKIDDAGAVSNAVDGLAAAFALTRDEGAFEMTLGPGGDAVGSLADLVAWMRTPATAPWRCGVPGVGALDVRRSLPQIVRKAG